MATLSAPAAGPGPGSHPGTHPGTHGSRSAGLRDLEAQQILDTMHDAFIAIGEDGVVLAWNTAAESMFGYDRSEAVGANMADLIVPEAVRALHYRSVRHMVTTGEAAMLGTIYEQLAQRRSGETFPVEISHWWVRDGERPLIYAFVRDITRRKHAEREIEDRIAAEALLTHRTLHDPLTGLANRVLVVDRVEQAVARRERTGGEVAVLFVDLDRFKSVNDSFGHDVGDQLLRETAARLRSVVRTVDTVARIAGDEFLILCEHLLGPAEATAVAGRVLAALAEPFVLADQRVRIGASVGVAFAADARSADAGSAEELLRNADAAMYRAKEQGGGRYVVFDAPMHERLMNRLRLERELDECIERDQLEVRYRPVRRMTDETITGVHLLLMWHHPRMGLLDPTVFLPVAEDTGAIGPLTAWAIERAAADVAAWDLAPTEPLRVVFNVSANHLVRSGVVDQLRTTLAAARIEPSRCLLGVDVRSWSAGTSPDRLVDVLRGVREIGIGLAIARYGVGYSALPLLHELPFEAMGLARDLTDRVREDARGLRVARATVRMAHDLGLKIYAEAVDDAAHWRALADIGCDIGQGGYAGESVTAAEVTALIRGANR